MDKKLQLLIIGYVWPEPDSSAAGRRMMELISLFQAQGWEITFASASAETEYMVDLSDFGVHTQNIAINSSSFDDFVTGLQPSIVMFDRFVTEEQFGWRVAEQCPDALRILDTEDLHCLRKARQIAVEEGRSFSKWDLLSEEMAKREIASILRCDLSLIISEAEMGLLREVFGVDSALLQYVPFLLDPITKTEMRQWPSFEARECITTIGNFRHAPNWDSVVHLKEEVWPRVRDYLSEAEIHVYGAYTSAEAQKLHAPEDGFYIEGRAENAKEVVGRAKVCLAPLRFGAGLKGKLVEAMQCGTPAVTTPVGAEGLNGVLPWCGAIGETTDDIAKATVELYTSKAAWKKAQQNGIRIVNERFDKATFGPTLIERITYLLDHLAPHRLQNFTGRMLQHHSMASTKYMGRWIEAKNS